MQVVLADDHILFRESFSLVLQKILPDASIVQIGDWDELRSLAERVKVDLLLVDLFMPGKESWETNLLHLLEHNSCTTCIISASNNRNNIQMAFEIGVNGYICKTASIHEMEQAIEQLCAGKMYIPSLVWAKPVSQRITPNSSRITNRQKTVLELLASGESNKAIGLSLSLTESTVKRHVSNIFIKLKVKNRTEAVKVARQQGLLPD